MSKCAIDGCESKATATIYCQMHYRRIRLYGDPHFVQRVQRKPSEVSKIYVDEDEGCALVELTQNKFAKIDISDVETVGQYNWYYSDSTGYAYSGKAGTSMQQFLIGRAPEGFEIDHEDRDKLNNQRSNISFKTYSENNKNTNKNDNKKCYSFHRASNKYQAYMPISKYEQIYLGLFVTEARAQAAVELARGLFDSVGQDKTKFKSAWKLMRTEKADTEKRDE